MATKKKNDILAEAGTDAAKWTEALAARLGELGNDALDASPGGDLFGWVANMIEAGRSEGYAKGQEDLSTAVNFFAEFDDAMKRDELTIFFMGKRGVGKTQMAGEIEAMLAPFEISANVHNVEWPNGGDYDVLTIKLDKEDHKALSAGEFINLAHVPLMPEIEARATTSEYVEKVNDGPVVMSRDKLGTIVGIAKIEGRAAILKEGLNADDELPVLRLPDVNAIEFSIATDGETTLTVDGQVRAVLGKPNNVIVMGNGERYVIMRDGEALETPPNRVDGE